MIRILRNTPATVGKTFYEDGVAVDPGTVTLTITAADGTVVLEDASTNGTGAAARTRTLAASVTGDLDTWTLTWESTDKGTLTDRAEVVGGFLFSLPDLGSVKLSHSETVASEYSVAEMVAVRTLVEVALEDACAVAFVPRYTMETLSGTGGATVMLSRPMVSGVRSVTVGGAAVDASGVTVSGSGRLYRGGSAWTRGFENITVGYEHGHGYPPARMSHAGLLLAKRWLIEGPVDDRATSMSNEAGTFALVTPGMRGMLFDLPEVNAAVQQYDMRALVA